MHRKEITEKNYQLAFQKLILSLSFDFMDINKKNYDEKINNLLKQLSQFLNSDRTYFFYH